MTLQSPLYLVALFALLVPLAIHLLAKRNPKRAKVGSVKFIEPKESKTFRRLRFHDAGLFALRALAFATLALSLASPEIACEQKRSGKGWVLVDPLALAEEQPKAFYETLDSLARAGYELRSLETNFPKISLENGGGREVGDLWSLLAEADKICPSEMAFVVASPPREVSLNGKRPTLSRDVVFVPTRIPETKWIERVSQIAEDSLLVLIGTSDENETKFFHLVAPIPETAAVIPPIEIRRAGDSLALALVSNPSETTWFSPTQKRKWTIVFDDAFREALPYLERALNAVAAFAPTGTVVEVKPRNEFRRDDSERLVWLASDSIPNRPKTLDARGFSAHRFFEGAWIDSLAEILLPPTTTRNDARKASTLLATPNAKKKSEENQRRESLTFPLWLVATSLLFIERWITFRNSQNPLGERPDC
ncbi:MAG: BatA domain-containing protein [Chloroherpetonaceae bacterium]|nr:BatA domain-containing protein [Chloroherpetonaceae bacterium]MDW8436860.1 BatA domain-containing protein [Chloroherpetonaceae bacterium]